MLEILMELGLNEEEAQKVISAFDAYFEEKDKKKKEEEAKKQADIKEENSDKAEKNEGDEPAEENAGNKKKKASIAPMGKAQEDIPTKEEFEKMGYLARLELAKSNPKLYEKLKDNQ